MFAIKQVSFIINLALVLKLVLVKIDRLTFYQCLKLRKEVNNTCSNTSLKILALHTDFYS